MRCLFLLPKFLLWLVFLEMNGRLSVMTCPLKCSCAFERPLWTTFPYGEDFEKNARGNNITINCESSGRDSIFVKEELADIDPSSVVKLIFSRNRIKEIKGGQFGIFKNMNFLDLSSNTIDQIHPDAFKNLPIKILLLNGNHLPGFLNGIFPPALEELYIEDNFLLVIPSALSSLRQLKTLSLARNKIYEVQEGDLLGLGNLISLDLRKNYLKSVEDRSLMRLSSVEIINLSKNLLIEIPSAILFCKTLKYLYLDDNKITWISADSFQGLTSLEEVSLDNNPLKNTHVDSFRQLPVLKKLILKESRKLSVFPNLEGTNNLEEIRIDRGSLEVVPNNLCTLVPKLRSLVLHNNGITHIPILKGCHHLRLIDLSNNEIKAIPAESFLSQNGLHDLLLQRNQIKEVSNDTFIGLSNLQILDLEYNMISFIHPEAFVPLLSLEDVNLGNNFFPELPSKGFENVFSLKVHNNKYLKIFPGPESFHRVRSLTLSYAYHCCPFMREEEGSSDQMEEETINESVIFDTDGFKELDAVTWNVSSIWQNLDFKDVWKNLAEEQTGKFEIPTISETIDPSSSSQTYRVNCIPKPGPFMPCNDLFDWWTLRCGVWIVFLLALLGNGIVVVVLTFARAKMDVPRFLVANLAFADFFMGVYLGFLAVVDASTLGEFRMYAIPWQMSAGCQVAGFFGVLSSELSVYTLTVITLERNYAITHAMHLNKRLSLRQAAIIMVGGWIFSATIASLPLMEISDYRKFAVCLPFETEGAGIIYVIFLMFINGVAFFTLMGCYLKIYCAIRGSQAWNSNDSRIAKRMALLVFTDFLCWAPIAFFSLTAAFGLQLISLEEAKIFTVFIFPLNSCCNPFLYALLTKQFKKDCVMLCKTIEESRVTRGIGRCRNSSNFSNRQTPPNTNSAVDQISKGDNQGCNCPSKMKDRRKFRSRLRLAAFKYLFCNKDVGERKSAREHPCQSSKSCISKSKIKRHASLSSENYSSSWSDAFKKSNMAISLKLLEKRKPNTWYLVRKPSQESNLSSSRNDSSATTASTSTWRISRSSVSSDISSGGSKGLIKGDTQGSLRIGSIRDRRGERGSLGAISRNPQHPTVVVMQNSTTPGTWVSSLIKGKPKLQRQSAMEREAYFPNKNDSDITNLCPLHHIGENLSCVYEQESYEEEEALPLPETNVTYLTPSYQAGNNNITFVPRKLSTISSRSVSMNRDVDKEDASPLLEDVIKNSDILVTKDKVFMRKGRCVSLTVLPQFTASHLTTRCPSDGQLCSNTVDQKEKLVKSAECIGIVRSSDKEAIPSHASPVCTETTGLMASDSEDDNNDDVFLEDGRRRPLETHFPLEEEDEPSLRV